MTTLRVFIHHFDQQLDKLIIEWLLFGTMGQLTRQGKDALNDLPIADNIEVVIPADWVSFTTVTLPAGNRKHVLDALPYLIEDHLMASPETVHVVITESFPNNKVSANTVLASIDKQKVSDILRHLKQHGITPSRLIPATLVTEFMPNSWSLVCDKHAFFVRTAQNNGLALSFDDENNTNHRLPLALQLAINQAQSSQSAPKEIFVYGNAIDENMQLDLADWSSKVNISFIKKSNDWKSNQPLINAKEGMNFLQGPFQPANQGWAALSQAKPALWFAGLIVLISLIGSSVDWAHKSLEKNRLDEEMKTLFTSTFPDATNIVDASLQMQRKLIEMQHASGETERNDFLPLLAKVSERTGGLANISAIDYVDNQLTLGLQANNEEVARNLVQKISIPDQIISIQNLKATNNAVNYHLVFRAAQ